MEEDQRTEMVMYLNSEINAARWMVGKGPSLLLGQTKLSLDFVGKVREP